MFGHHRQTSSEASVAGVANLLFADPEEAAKAIDGASSTSMAKAETNVAVAGPGPNVLKATKPLRYRHHQVVLPANGMRFGFSSMQGLRDHMEDCVVLASTLSGELADVAFVAIHDGHGGLYAADYSAKHLLPVLLSEPRIKDALRNPVMPGNIQVFKEGFVRCDTMLRKKIEVKTGLTEGRDGIRRAGTTAATAFITPKHIIMANAGDSRAVLMRNNSVYQINVEHSPMLESERERVEAAGSFVSKRGRIHDNLNVSRGLGDHGHKDAVGLPLQMQAVSPEPDVHIITRVPGQDQFLVVGSDGLYESLDNKAVGAFVLTAWKETNGDIQKVAQGLVDFALEAGSKDNVTGIVVAFNTGADKLLSASSSPTGSPTLLATAGAGSSGGQPPYQPRHHHPHPEDEPGAYYRGERGDPKMR